MQIYQKIESEGAVARLIQKKQCLTPEKDNGPFRVSGTVL